MLYVDYGKNNLYGYFDCVRGDKIIRCNVYRCNGLLAWVAREYADKNNEGIRSYLWGFFNDMQHVENSCGLNGYDDFISGYITKMTILRKAPQKVKDACIKMKRICKIKLEYVDDLDEHIYPYTERGEE